METTPWAPQDFPFPEPVLFPEPAIPEPSPSGVYTARFARSQTTTDDDDN